MTQMSESFAMGYGGIGHNLRQTKDGNVRQNGIQERRFINEYIVKNKYETVDELVRETIRKEVGKKLDQYNLRQIQTRHPERVKTIDEWIEATKRTHKGKDIMSEYIIQIGDRYTGSPYEMETDKDGNIIDTDGQKIKSWDTRKTPAYKNGEIKESKISKKLKRIYKDFLKEFQKKNPRARIVCAAIHGDEHGGLHMHINVIWFCDTRNGIGIGLGKTSAMAQQYQEQEGIKTKNTQAKNAQVLWQTDMRWLLKSVAEKHGIERQDMGNTEEHDSIPEYKKKQDKRCEALEAKEEELNRKEAELKQKEKELYEKERILNTDIAKQEWYILKTRHKEYYAKIHAEYLKQKKSNKSIDKTNGCML